MQHALSRGQIAAYAALGIVLVLLGARAIRGAEATATGEVATGGDLVAPSPHGADSGPGALVVHVSGAVRDPGVYRFQAGARVGDAVERAGGAAGRAAADAINLAAPLADGQQVVVPERLPASAGAAGAAPGGLGPAAGGGPEPPISLGTASAADLETIAGIGPVTAEKIIAFRDANGGIAAIEDLDAVPGIGPATLAALAERLQP